MGNHHGRLRNYTRYANRHTWKWSHHNMIWAGYIVYGAVATESKYCWEPCIRYTFRRLSIMAKITNKSHSCYSKGFSTRTQQWRLEEYFWWSLWSWATHIGWQESAEAAKYRQYSQRRPVYVAPIRIEWYSSRRTCVTRSLFVISFRHSRK